MCGCSLHTDATSAETTASALGTSVFTVADMTCGHCASTIKSAFAEKLPGAAVEVDIPAKQVRVSAPASVASEIITGAGYTPEIA